MLIKENRAITRLRVSEKDTELHCALAAMTLASKNIYNTALYYIYGVYSLNQFSDTDAYVLTEHQRSAYVLYNETITKINQARTEAADAYNAKLLVDAQANNKSIEELEFKQPKLLCLITIGDIKSSLILDATVIDNYMRDVCPDYKALPSFVTQQVLKQVTTNYTSYFKAVSAYIRQPDKFKARPRRPQYLDKHSRNMLRFNAINGKLYLGTLKKRAIYEDYQKQFPLRSEAVSSYDNLDVSEIIEQAKSRYAPRLRDNLRCVEIRVIPKRNDFKVEVVFEVCNALAESSLLAKVANAFAIEKDKPADKFFNESLKTQSEAILSYVNNPANALNLRVAGIDLGMKNIASVSYSTGNKGAVYSATQFNRDMQNLDIKLDKLKSKVMKATVLELSKNPEALSKEQLSEYYAELNKVYATTEYADILQTKADLTNTMLHKVSSAIVLDAKARCIDLIVIGKNEGWKSYLNIGQKNNRRFHNIPHAKLIELIQYKAREYSIAVATTEEAYTSKASFVLNEALPSFGASSTSTTRLGRRVGNTFKILKEHLNKVADKWKVVHADIHGAFNMIRKFIKSFRFSESLTPKYHVKLCRSDYSFKRLA